MDANGSQLSPEERRRRTAAAIARKKVLAAYDTAIKNAQRQSDQPVVPRISPESWQRYHSNWQNYYQKYYSDYYNKAAHHYLATQRLRDRQQIEQSATETRAPDPGVRSESESESSMQPAVKLRQKFARMSERLRDRQRRRRLIPIIAGVVVVLILLFLQFNRLIFAPIAAYISPGDETASSLTPVNPNVTQAVSPEPKLIIPKLNVNVPVFFGISNDNATMMDAMNKGVAQFAIPGADAMPGEAGNLLITGHSAGDIYSINQYKFIFSGLERLVPGDLIYINYNSVRYTYTVTGSDVVEPTDMEALTRSTTKPTLTLITCTPLGTSRYRLLVRADQVSPTVGATEAAVPAKTQTTQPESNLPANEPSFFESIWNFLTNNRNSN